MESIEQVRLELANFRNDLDLTKHASSENSEKLNTLTSDATFRLGWLEERQINWSLSWASLLQHHLSTQLPTWNEERTCE